MLSKYCKISLYFVSELCKVKMKQREYQQELRNIEKITLLGDKTFAVIDKL